MPKKTVHDRAAALKLRIDGYVRRIDKLRRQVEGRLGSQGDPDKRDRFGDPRLDLITLEVWVNRCFDVLERGKPERGDEVHTRLDEGPRPKEAGRG